MNTKALLAFVAAGTVSTIASAATPNVLFYGNSYTLAGESVPTLFQRIAVAGGQVRPNVENAAVASMTLGWHLSSNTAVISDPQDFLESPGFQWDQVVMQEYSTKPTDIPGRGNPASFKNDAKALCEFVAQHSPAVTPILYQTWTRSPMNTADLTSFYPALTQGQSAPLYAAANEMQSELSRYYGEAASLIGSNARVAPVGDAFKAGNWVGMYDTDLSHPSGKGTLLASLVIYETIYNTPATSISYSAMSSQMGLSGYGIQNTTDWNNLTALASSVVPEPTSLGMIGIGAALVLRRRRAV